MSVVLDAGALVAVERAHRETIALIKQELLAGRTPVTHGGPSRRYRSRVSRAMDVASSSAPRVCGLGVPGVL